MVMLILKFRDFGQHFHSDDANITVFVILMEGDFDPDEDYCHYFDGKVGLYRDFSDFSHGDVDIAVFAILVKFTMVSRFSLYCYSKADWINSTKY